MANLALTNVWKTFEGGTDAVRDVSLSVDDGEFIVLVGPSGCGKSTTLRMVAGLEEITRGEITIDGRVVNNVLPRDRDIAMVFQNYALYPHMSVYQNMAFGLRLRKTPKREIERRVMEAARMLDLEPLLGRKPKALSGGQRQRVAVGRAIVREPKAFLFDEPLSNLDAKLRVQMRSEFKELHQRLGTTTLYVTHDQEEAMTLGSRIVVMDRGEVQQVGTPFEVFSSPVNRFVAGFIGTPSMNFLPGRVFTGDKGLRWREAPADHAESRGLELQGVALEGLGSDGMDVVMGIRPQAASLVRNASTGAGTSADSSDDTGPVLRGTVKVVEPLGDQMDVRLEAGASGVELVFRVRADASLSAGERADFRIDPGRIRMFETGPRGAALSLRTPEAAQALP